MFKRFEKIEVMGHVLRPYRLEVVSDIKLEGKEHVLYFSMKNGYYITLRGDFSELEEARSKLIGSM